MHPQCPAKKTGSLKPGNVEHSEVVSTTFPLTIFFKSDSQSCRVTCHFREYGLYHLNVSSQNKTNCSALLEVDGKYGGHNANLRKSIPMQDFFTKEEVGCGMLFPTKIYL